MGDLATYLGLYVKGDAAHKVDELEKGFQRLSTRGEAHMGALSRSMGVAGRAVDGLANRYTALLSGAAGVGAVHQVAALDERYVRLGINADKSREEMDKLKKSIFETASQNDIRVDPSQILSGVEQIVEKTGDLNYATESLKTLGYVIQATGSQGEHVGALLSEFKKLGIEGSAAILMAMDTLVTQGKAGAFTMQNLSSQGERAVSAYASMGYRGQGAVQAMGALLQVARMGTGSAEQATTAYENLLSTISKKHKELGAHGIKVFDQEAAKKGLEVFRPMPDILKDIITATKGRATLLQGVFDVEGYRAITKIASEFQDTKGFGSLDNFNNIKGNGAQLIGDSARAAGTFNAAMTQLNTQWGRFADANLTGVVRDLADALNSLKPEQVQSTMKALAYGAVAVAGVIAVKKGVDAVRWTADTMRFVKGGRGGIAGAAAGVAGGIAGGGTPMPVIVMNWPGGALGGGAPVVGQGAGQAGSPTTAAASAAAGSKGLLSRIASRGAGIASAIGRHAAPLVTVGLGAYDAIDSYLDGDKRSAIGAVGRTAGSLLGGIGGGALGSMALPGVGTVAGGLAGAQAGGMGGEAIANRLYDWLAGEKERASEPTKVESTVALRLDLPPGVTARATNLSSSSGLDVDLGYTVLGP